MSTYSAVLQIIFDLSKQPFSMNACICSLSTVHSCHSYHSYICQMIIHLYELCSILIFIALGQWAYNGLCTHNHWYVRHLKSDSYVLI